MHLHSIAAVIGTHLVFHGLFNLGTSTFLNVHAPTRARVLVTKLACKLKFSEVPRARDACRNPRHKGTCCRQLKTCTAPVLMWEFLTSKQGAPRLRGMLFRRGGRKTRPPSANSGFLRFADPARKAKPSGGKACTAVWGVIGRQFHQHAEPLYGL